MGWVLLCVLRSSRSWRSEHYELAEAGLPRRALVAAPLDARAADLVIWWNKGVNSEEDAAVREIIAAFEQTSGKRVALTQPAEDELPGQVAAALETGQPPDFAFSVLLQYYIGQWAFEDRLVDLSDAVGLFFGPVRSGGAQQPIAAEREDRAKGPVCAAACSLDQP